MVDEWMKQYPSVWVTRSHIGDREYANLFYGEGNKLLYQLKNQMKFRDLGQLKMTRLFTDGTVLTASSVFGHDQIIIDVSKSIIVEVDYCCQKDPAAREVFILALREVVNEWRGGCEDRGDCESYGECDETWDWCPVPAELPFDSLLEETSFRARPEEKVLGEGETKPPGDGSCPPYVWEFISSENVGSIEPSGDFKESMVYTPPESGSCKDDITISVKDRCETVYLVHRLPCCDEAKELEIGYTSLQMSVNTSQTLTAEEGCAPYSWDLTVGGGTLTPSGDTLTALYTAPSSNVNCDQNPTIVLTDCCGKTAQIKIGIGAGSDMAGYHYIFQLIDICSGAWCYIEGYCPEMFPGSIYRIKVDMYRILCDSTETYFQTSYDFPFKLDGGFSSMHVSPGGDDIYQMWNFAPGCGLGESVWFGKNISTPQMSGDFYYDSRSAEQKLNGCCPWQFA